MPFARDMAHNCWSASPPDVHLKAKVGYIVIIIIIRITRRCCCGTVQAGRQDDENKLETCEGNNNRLVERRRPWFVS